MSHRLVVFVFEEAVLLDISGPVQVFHGVRAPGARTPFYDISYCSLQGGPVKTDVGVDIDTVSVEDIMQQQFDTLMVVGGSGVFSVYQQAVYQQAIRNLSALAKRSVSICTGAFLLAAAGLLAGKKAVTHWRRCQRLSDEFPEINVYTDPIYVQDGSVWTSAGVTAGIDLALALVEADIGRRTALAIAQELVVFMKRPGGQQQYSAALKAQTADQEGDFEALHGWASENLSAQLSVADLARQAGMSLRSFTRQYKAVTGNSPGDMLSALRFETARHLLTETGLPLKRVADLSGYGHYERMRRAFVKNVNSTPRHYRERFALL